MLQGRTIGKWIATLTLFGTMIILPVPVLQAQTVTPERGYQTRGRGFKDIVKYLETTYQARKTKIPMLGLANFAIKLIRPAGVKGFKLAVFEDRNFAGDRRASSFDQVMRGAYKKDWMPMVRVNSRRDGEQKTFIYARNAGKDVQFAVVTFQEMEAVVLEVKLNPDAAARFMENPRIMGVSLNNSVRGQSGVQVARQSSTPTSAPQAPQAEVKAAAAAPAPEESVPAPPSTEATRPQLAATRDEVAAETVSAVRPEDRGDRNAIRIETRLVNLNVKAMDRAGKPVTDLRQEDFQVYEDGVAQQVAHFKPVDAPVNLILLLDLSGSTKSKRKSMAEAARRFIDALPERDKVSVVAFTRRYRPLTDFTDDKVALRQSLRKIEDIAGGTAFYDSMWKAMDQFATMTESRKAIVVLTDGEDESLLGTEETVHSYADLLGRASEEDVTVYPIYFKGSNHYNKLGILFGSGSLTGNDQAKAARRQLEELAEQTGGEVISAQLETDLDAAYQRVAGELHTLYSLAYSPDKPRHNGEFRQISVKLAREGAIARTRRGYYDR